VILDLSLEKIGGGNLPSFPGFLLKIDKKIFFDLDSEDKLV
jgi:hypothetical protein